MDATGIYKITSPSKRVYIGQSTNIKKRWDDYKKLRCQNQSKLIRSFKKHGIKKHKFEIICKCTESELNKLEIYYIELYQCFNSEYGLNLKEGGGCKGKFSDVTKEKMRRFQTGRKHPHSEATKVKMRKPHNMSIGGSQKLIDAKLGKGKAQKSIQYIKDNIKIKTQKQIGKELNIHQSTISKLLKLWH